MVSIFNEEPGTDGRSVSLTEKIYALRLLARRGWDHRVDENVEFVVRADQDASRWDWLNPLFKNVQQPKSEEFKNSIHATIS